MVMGVQYRKDQSSYSTVHYKVDEHLFLTRHRVWNREDIYHSLDHQHRELEFLRIQKGSLICVVDGKGHELKEGDVFFINSFHLHTSSLKKDPCVFNVLLIHPDAYLQSSQLITPFLRTVVSSTEYACLHFHAGENGTEKLTELIDQCVGTAQEKQPGWQLDLMSNADQILKALWLRITDEKRQPELDNPDALLLSRMVEYIYTHYQERIYLEDIAASGNMSASKCSRLFQTCTGHSPVDFLIQYRLEAACSLLRTSREPVAAISEECGFEQPSYFNRQFRKFLNCTPVDYRRKPTDTYIH